MTDVYAKGRKKLTNRKSHTALLRPISLFLEVHSCWRVGRGTALLGYRGSFDWLLILENQAVLCWRSTSCIDRFVVHWWFVWLITMMEVDLLYTVWCFKKDGRFMLHIFITVLNAFIIFSEMHFAFIIFFRKWNLLKKFTKIRETF